ncbi:MAG: FtsW/RodA/SpoVE family cell cycle protein [Actinomycetota bacterium]|nr:FtsW/RodA/SpoVE family cell cycle protein [Actinomycetota bacterium]MEC9058279.1 FtsW/RodA/SpoVE family cell cycle protein [Actinomycetota bacterium]MED5361734.1 FtsW/RodA/SpoVE family cell cycle protein [Actinomycetota bacterium]
MNNQRVVELTLLLLAAFITIATVAVAAVGEDVAIGWDALPYLVGLLTLWAISHLALRRWAPTSNGLLFPITALLQGLGFAFMLRIDPDSASRHFAWSLAATCGFLVVLAGLRNLVLLQRAWAYIGIFGFLVFVTPAIVTTNSRQPTGSQVFDLGPVRVAPQQLGILCLVVFFAAWLTNHRFRNTAEHLGELERLDGDPSRFLPLVSGWLTTSVIIIFQFDMSLAFVTFAIFVSMWWVAVGRMVDLTIYLAAIGGSIAIALVSITELQDRFAAWIDPWSNSEFGAPITRSMFALAGGGLTGTGPGGGSADWVPGATDQFAFVPIAEELGFIGGAAVFSSYLLLVGVGLRLAIAARREFDSILAIGTTIFLGSQAWAAIAVAVRLLPPTGSSLPFVAFNGSVLVTCNLALVLLLRISETVPFVSDRTQVLPQVTPQARGGK